METVRLENCVRSAVGSLVHQIRFVCTDEESLANIPMIARRNILTTDGNCRRIGIPARDFRYNWFVGYSNTFDTPNTEIRVDADIIVWIVPEFNDAHQDAIQWLNTNSRAHTDLFAIRLEVWRIDDSPPAVRLNTVENQASGKKPAAKRRAFWPWHSSWGVL